MAGLRKVQRALKRATDKQGRGALEGARAAAELIADRAEPLTPLRTGKLRASQVVTDNGDTRTRPTAGVGYTDKKAPWVHERFYKYRVGGAKFLQRAADESAREALLVIRERMAVQR